MGIERETIGQDVYLVDGRPSTALEARVYRTDHVYSLGFFIDGHIIAELYLEWVTSNDEAKAEFERIAELLDTMPRNQGWIGTLIHIGFYVGNRRRSNDE